MHTTNIYKNVANFLGIDLLNHNFEEEKSILINKVNDLILHDFEKLINILYRMDVSENKIKDLLSKNTQTDAAEIIVKSMLERELEKKESRVKFKTNNNQISDDEKW